MNNTKNRLSNHTKNQSSNHTLYDDNNVLYIDIDKLHLYYKLHKDDIDKNHDYYLDHIRRRPELYSDLQSILNGIYELDNKRTKELLILGQKISPKSGGGPLTAGIVVGSYVVIGVITYFIWQMFNKGTTCDYSYELNSEKEKPDTQKILSTILPEWLKKEFENKLDEGKNLDLAINDVRNTLKEISKKFEIFSEKGSFSKHAVTSSVKIATSAVAAVITSGTGDKLVNAPFLVTKAIQLTSTTFDKLADVLAKINKIINSLNKTLEIIQKQVSKITSEAENFNKNQDAIMRNISNNNTKLNFIYDLFSLDFKGGPAHIRCIVQYIMMKYLSSNEHVKEVYTLLCMMNDIYITVDDTLIEFIGSAIDMLVPGTFGLAGAFASKLKEYSYAIYRNTRDNLEKKYNNLPENLKQYIQNPTELKKYIFETLKTYTLGFSEQLIPESVKGYLEKGIDILAYSIHKGLSMLFMFLNVFIVFAKLNAGINQELGSKNINMKQLLKECEECGMFEVHKINPDGSLNKEDLASCKKCKKFFVEDESIVMDDALLYTKCMIYRDRRDLAKKGYLNLKSKIMKSTKIKNKSDLAVVTEIVEAAEKPQTPE